MLLRSSWENERERQMSKGEMLAPAISRAKLLLVSIGPVIYI